MTAVTPSPLAAHADCCQLPGNSHRDSNCRVRFPARQQWTLLSGTRYQQEHGWSGKLADVMAVGNLVDGTLHVASVELKSGSFDVGEVREQLQSAADVLDQQLPKDPPYRLRYVAVLFHKRIQRPMLVMKELATKRNRVQFRGTAVRIGLETCGSELGARTWDPRA